MLSRMKRRKDSLEEWWGRCVSRKITRRKLSDGDGTNRPIKVSMTMIKAPPGGMGGRGGDIGGYGGCRGGDRGR